MPGEKTYRLAIGKWRRSGTVTIQSVLDTKIARFPIGFLASCGDNSWNYVSFVVSLLVEADPQHPASIIEPNTGLLVNPDDVPVAGTYRFVEQGAFMRSRLSFVLRSSSTTRQTQRGPVHNRTVVFDSSSASFRNAHDSHNLFVARLYRSGTTVGECLGQTLINPSHSSGWRSPSATITALLASTILLIVALRISFPTVEKT